MIEEDLNIGKDVQKIVEQDLQKRKVCSRFVPHSLTAEQKEDRVSSCQEWVQLAENEPEWFKKIIPGDESLFHAYDPATKRQSAAWVGKNSPRPKKLRIQKTMLVVFFDWQGVVHKEFIPEGQTMNATMYKDILAHLLQSKGFVRKWFIRVTDSCCMTMHRATELLKDRHF